MKELILKTSGRWNLPEYIELDVECDMCHGIGHVLKQDDGVTGEDVCATCNGKGKLLTENGQNLREFIKEWLSVSTVQSEVIDKNY